MKQLCTTTLALAALLMVGCNNPFLSAYTGEQRAQLDEDAPVRVTAIDTDDPEQAGKLKEQLDDARTSHQQLGTASFISSHNLRNQHAADAARKLGADLVIYAKAYRNTTTEIESFGPYHGFHYRHYGHCHYGYHGYYGYHRRSYARTKHWYQYRAYFFDSGDEQP